MFERKLAPIERVDRSVLARLDDIELVLTGTSSISYLERHALHTARSAGVRSVAFLDHWTSYRRRFELNGELVLPDEIWVSDEHAERLARDDFPSLRVRRQANHYVDDVALEIRRLSKPRAPGSAVRVLFVTDPVPPGDSGFHAFGYDEIEALTAFIEWLDAGDTSVERLRIRPHPREAPSKYERFAAGARTRFPIEIAASGTLAEACAWADWVVGTETMAMVVALRAGKRVSSCVPAGHAGVLPFPEIQRLY